MKLYFYTRYARNGASSRLRFYAYAERWRERGMPAEVRHFFSAAYLQKLYSGGKKSLLGFAAATLRRWWQLLAPGKHIIAEYELMPFVPYPIERLVLRGRKLILNFDDDVAQKYASNPFLRHKFDHLIRRAEGVICANEELALRARLYNGNVMKLATLVDLAAYDAVAPEPAERLTLVWIGTPATYFYLEQASDALRAMRQKRDFELLVIACKSLAARAIEGVEMRFEEWSESTEVALLKQAHIGIMPLPANDAFAQGKSAYKLIQYCAAGIPAIASNVGENPFVLRDGVTGILAGSPAEWAKALEAITEPERYRTMCAACRATAPEFSLEQGFERFKGFVERTFR